MVGLDFHVAARRNHFDPSWKIERAKVSMYKEWSEINQKFRGTDI
jgi:hypothetical protein